MMTTTEPPGDGMPRYGTGAGRERRESEKAIMYWCQKRQELGEGLTLASFGLETSAEAAWSHRFLISVDPIVQRSSLVLYGSNVAQLLHLPAQATPNVPMVRQLSGRHFDLFVKGCADTQKEMAPVRVEGEIPGSDGRIDQYRAAFMPVGIRPNSLTYFAFGAYNSRTIELERAA